jgi:hypothetical protein
MLKMTFFSVTHLSYVDLMGFLPQHILAMLNLTFLSMTHSCHAEFNVFDHKTFRLF